MHQQWVCRTQAEGCLQITHDGRGGTISISCRDDLTQEESFLTVGVHAVWSRRFLRAGFVPLLSEGKVPRQFGCQPSRDHAR